MKTKQKHPENPQKDKSSGFGLLAKGKVVDFAGGTHPIAQTFNERIGQAAFNSAEKQHLLAITAQLNKALLANDNEAITKLLLILQRQWSAPVGRLNRKLGE